MFGGAADCLFQAEGLALTLRGPIAGTVLGAGLALAGLAGAGFAGALIGAGPARSQESWPQAGLAAPQPRPAACPPRGAPLVRVNVSDPDPRVLAPVPADQLRRLADVPDEQVGDGPVLHHLGLTMSRVEWRSEITVRSQGPAGGPVCGVPSEVRLSLVHAEHSIRLAREIPRGGCLAREVLEHERRHVEVNRRTLRQAAEGLRSAARAWAARAEAQAPDAAAAAQSLQEDLTATVEPVLARLRAARQAGHDAIDTQEEYDRLGQVCGRDQRRLNRSLGAH